MFSTLIRNAPLIGGFILKKQMTMNIKAKVIFIPIEITIEITDKKQFDAWYLLFKSLDPVKCSEIVRKNGHDYSNVDYSFSTEMLIHYHKKIRTQVIK